MSGVEDSGEEFGEWLLEGWHAGTDDSHVHFDVGPGVGYRLFICDEHQSALLRSGSAKDVEGIEWYVHVVSGFAVGTRVVIRIMVIMQTLNGEGLASLAMICSVLFGTKHTSPREQIQPSDRSSALWAISEI